MILKSRPLLVAALCALLPGCRTAERVVVPEPDANEEVTSAARINASLEVSQTGTSYVMDLVFHQHGQPTIPVRFEVDKSSFDAIDRPWGYKESDLAKFGQTYEASRRAAFEAAQAREASQSDLDAQLKNLHDGFENAKHDYILSRGFRFLPDGSTEVDMPALVHANAPRLAPLARALEVAAKASNRPHTWIVGAAQALVQTTLEYQEVPVVVDGTHTGGVWPPLMTLVYGRGDCDTKAALLAAILANYPGMRILGIKVSGHYLVGLSMKPGREDAYIQFEGRKYVLFEPAGPSRIRAGEVADDTKLLFRRGRPYSVERLF